MGAGSLVSVDILTFGEPMFELAEVETDGATAYVPGFGGDASNVAVAAARQGAHVGVFTRVGRDTFGDRFLALWADEGIDASTVQQDAEAPTGTYLISYGPAGHEFSYYRKGSAASLVRPADVPIEAIASARMLHLSGISQAISDGACDASFAAIEVAKNHGVRVSYDTNLRLKLWPLARARAIIMATAGMSDVCLPSLEDGRQLTGKDDPDAIADAFLSAGAKLVVLKLGADGALVADGRSRERVPAFPVEPVDATGAGDTFDGAFLAKTIAGATPVDAATYANAAAALSTLGHGAVVPIPRAEVVERFLKERGWG